MLIDCDSCAVRGLACGDCVVTVLLGVSPAGVELDAAEQLRNAAQVIMQNPAALELRRMQMITEVGAEQNTMTIVMMPSEFVAMARNIGEMTGKTGG